MEHATIFVQVASYRDPEVIATIQDALAKAYNPSRIRFGVFLQNSPAEAGQGEYMKYLPNTEFVEVSHTEARGCCWARNEAQKMWRGEQFTFQIDPHMRFSHYWDEQLVLAYQLCGREKALLSWLAPGYIPPDQLVPQWTASIVADRFEGNGVLHQKCGHAFRSDRPKPGAFICAHSIFAPSQLWQECPYDPWVYFWGEEVSYAVRAFTHGWDIFHPHRCITWHYYCNKERPRHWDDHANWWEVENDSVNRWREIFEGKDLGAYGLGKVRSLFEYEQMAGVNFGDRTIQPLKAA